jgi:hypothetical protein
MGQVRALVSLACLVALAAVAVTSAPGAIRELVHRLPERNASTFEQATAGSPITEPQAVEWARSRIPSTDTYRLVPGTVCDKAEVAQWVTFRLLPRQAALTTRDADALIWCAARAKVPPGFGQPETFGSAIAVSRRLGQR